MSARHNLEMFERLADPLERLRENLKQLEILQRDLERARRRANLLAVANMLCACVMVCLALLHIAGVLF